PGEAGIVVEVRVHVLAPDRARAGDVVGERAHELVHAAGERARSVLAGELAEDELGLRARKLVARGAGELGVDGRAEQRRMGGAAGALRTDERRVVGLVPWTERVDAGAVGVRLGQQ